MVFDKTTLLFNKRRLLHQRITTSNYMNFYVYIILSKKNGKYYSYVGYTNNLARRIDLHNRSKGAKSTRGKKWFLAYKKKFNKKTLALKYEYKLKNDKKKRIKIKERYFK